MQLRRLDRLAWGAALPERRIAPGYTVAATATLDDVLPSNLEFPGERVGVAPVGVLQSHEWGVAGGWLPDSTVLTLERGVSGPYPVSQSPPPDRTDWRCIHGGMQLHGSGAVGESAAS